jgi:hypothetical protein
MATSDKRPAGESGKEPCADDYYQRDDDAVIKERERFLPCKLDGQIVVVIHCVPLSPKMVSGLREGGVLRLSTSTIKPLASRITMLLRTVDRDIPAVSAICLAVIGPR